MTEKEKKNREELFRLMKKHPDLPVMPLVDSDVVLDGDYRYWFGSWGSCHIGEIYYGQEYIHIRGDEDEEYVLSDMKGCSYYEAPDGRELKDLTEEEWDGLYKSLPWKKCILVNINP